MNQNPSPLELLDQIIEMAKIQEQTLKAMYIQTNQASKSVGESAVVFYLNRLRELMVTPATNTVVLGGRTYNLSLGTFVSSAPFVSPGPPANADKLPDPLHLGLLVKVTRPNHSWLGWGGEVVDHYINGDDCSGNWGAEMYCIEKANGERFSVPAKACTIL